MTTLADVLHDADPLPYETRSAGGRAVTRATVLSAPAHVDVARPISRRAFAVSAAVAATGILALVASFSWQNASVDLIAAVRFEARLAGSKDVIVRNGQIARAAVVPGHTAQTFNIAVTFTADGAKKMREVTARNVGKQIELLVDGKVAMAPVIRSAFPDASGQAVITGDYTRADADRIVSGIIGK
jgi:preprotein translocase subunit SecD